MLINVLLLVAQCSVCAIAWHAVDVQARGMSELALVSKAARYHQDADAISANLRADVNAALASTVFGSLDAAAVTDSLQEHVVDLRKDLRTLEQIDLPPELLESLNKVESVAYDFVAHAVEAVNAAQQDRTAAGPQLAKFMSASDALAAAMEQQTAVLAARIVTANELAAHAGAEAKLWLIVSAAVTTLLVSSLVALVGFSIRRSLQKVRDVTREIAAGNLDVRNDEVGRDEIGQLAHAVNQMADSLREVIGRLRADAERDAFNNELGDALDAADTEPAAYEIVARAMRDISPKLPAELLVSDSSRTHLERATQHPAAGAPGCLVESPYDCMAVRRGSTQTFANSDALNACRYLRNRACLPASAVCVPLSFMGRSIGVLHAAAAEGNAPPTPRQVEQLSTLGAQAGARIGTVRAFARTQIQAATDSLTGLANRRAAEDTIRALMAARRKYAFVLSDLDHFKHLNDRFGHGGGDAALRLYADVLRRAVRERDLAARWGGEEFVIILPEASAETGGDIVTRIQEGLRQAVASGSVPAFTASFGISDSSMGESFRDVARLADDALYRAKNEGRDRAQIADSKASETGSPRHTEHSAAIDITMLTGPHPTIEAWPLRRTANDGPDAESQPAPGTRR